MKQRTVGDMLRERFKTGSPSYKKAVLTYFKVHNAFKAGLPSLSHHHPRTSFEKTQLEYNGQPS